MDNVSVRKEDELLMSLVHFFVTKENYAPIYVHGVKDEIWLENVDGPYRVIRISSNSIINEEQFKYDQYRIKDILRQIKKKTMSFNVNALNINLNEDSSIYEDGLKNIDNIKVSNIEEFENNKDILEIFPNVKDSMIKDTNGFDLIFNVTRDINAKTEKDNKTFEKIFTAKTPIVTYIIMALCVIMYIVSFILIKLKVYNDIGVYALLGATNKPLLEMGQIYRLITYAFLHAGIAHLLCNMYSLYVVGPQIESKFGKWRFLIIYLVSAISGALLSAGFGENLTVGASGAIFGLMGSMLYFGIRFRLYLKDSIKTRIIPVIAINLLLGFMISGIDNWCHIGGLIAGYLASMAVGIPDTDKKSDIINGIILLGIFLIALVYIAFFR